MLFDIILAGLLSLLELIDIILELDGVLTSEFLLRFSAVKRGRKPKSSD